MYIKIDNGQDAFGPGDTVNGSASWSLTEAPDHVKLYLLWYTEGKGDEDTAIVDEVELAVGERRGDERFSLTLPEGPYSFEGRYISLQWALELVTKDPFNVVRENIMLSPWVKKVILDKGSDDDMVDLSSDDD